MHVQLKIIIADDHILFRSGLALLLKKIPGVKKIDQAKNGREVLELLEFEFAHIVFMDINMPVLNGIETTRIIKDKFSNVKVIALSMHDDKYTILDIFDAGADGYLLKNTDVEELTRAIRSVIRNEKFTSREVNNILLQKFLTDKASQKQLKLLEPLTEKEKEILVYICNGIPATRIAEKLDISIKTVEAHKAKLYSKTGSTNIASLVMFAVKNNIVST